MSDNLQETIRESAKAPAKASGDAGSVEQHKLTEQIAADKYLASKAAASKPKRGLRFNKLVPPGADYRYLDGIRFDEHGNAISNDVLREHPGDDAFSLTENYDTIDASSILHYFRSDRPGQIRGIPDITPALPLFAQLRRFTLAVLAAAETAADFAGILYTDAPAGGEADAAEPFEPIELEKRSLLTMPGGWKMAQMHAEQPATTYAEFKREILNEIARCLNMPFNVAAGNSSGYNYASGRLDHQTYFKSIRVEQSQMARTVLDRILYAWLREAILIESYLPNSLRSLDSSFEHQWFWGGHEHVDPAKEANAQRIRLANHTKTLAHEYARQGRDWEAELKQRAKELALIRELSLSLDSTLMQDTGMRLLRHSIHTQFNYLSASRRKFDMSELDPVEPVDDCDDLVNTIGALLTSLTDALATLASAKASAATDVAALNAQINALWQQQVALNQQIAVTPLGPARDLLVAQANALEAQRNTLLARRDCKQYLVDGADIVTSIVDTTIAQYNTLDANSGGPCTPEQREILQQMIDLLFHALTITVNQIENIAAGCP